MPFVSLLARSIGRRNDFVQNFIFKLNTFYIFLLSCETNQLFMTMPSKFRPHSRVSRNLKCNCVCFALEDTQLDRRLWRVFLYFYFFLALKRSKKVCKLFARKYAWKLSLTIRKSKEISVEKRKERTWGDAGRTRVVMY